MSTKIYFAYRMPTRVFADSFLHDFRKCVFEAGVGLLRKLMSNITEKELREEHRFKKRYTPKLTFNKFIEEEGDARRLKLVFGKMVEASKSMERSLDDCIDCCLNLWIYKDKIYVIVYGECWLWEKFKPVTPVEDYAYWNNADGPDNLTRRQWKAREKTWDAVCLNTGWDDGRMIHDIVNIAKDKGLYHLARLIVGEEKAHIAAS